MIICVCYFTEKGREIASQIEQSFEDDVILFRQKEEALTDWVQNCFSLHLPILFVGACGIAVRAIAPYVKDKLSDSPVLVLDELGNFIIPILSGHMGGANELARRIEQKLGAKAVITTATDVEQVFSIDEFARRNGFWIRERQGIAKVSSRLLKKELVTIAIDPVISYEEQKIPGELTLLPFEKRLDEESDNKITADILLLSEETAESTDLQGNLITLISKEYILGMGCKKGKKFQELKDFVEKTLPVDINCQIYQLATIDLKAKEPGLLTLAQFYHLPFVTYTSKELISTKGDFPASEFVEKTTGVDNVCERAAVRSATGERECLILKKTCENGMTLAVARRIPKIESFKPRHIYAAELWNSEFYE